MLHNGQRVGLGWGEKGRQVKCLDVSHLKRKTERDREGENCIDNRKNSTFKNVNVMFFFFNATESLSQFLVTIIQECFRIAAWIFPLRGASTKFCGVDSSSSK